MFQRRFCFDLWITQWKHIYLKRCEWLPFMCPCNQCACTSLHPPVTGMTLAKAALRSFQRSFNLCLLASDILVCAAAMVQRQLLLTLRRLHYFGAPKDTWLAFFQKPKSSILLGCLMFMLSPCLQEPPHPPTGSKNFYAGSWNHMVLTEYS